MAVLSGNLILITGPDRRQPGQVAAAEIYDSLGATFGVWGSRKTSCLHLVEDRAQWDGLYRPEWLTPGSMPTVMCGLGLSSRIAAVRRIDSR